MKILALMGGRPGSSSEAMAKLALEGAREAGADELTAVRLLDLNIGPCTGCNACVDGLLQGTGVGACVRRDDFQWLTEQIMESDGIIVSLPIFEKTVPGYFKDLCDRAGPGMDAALRLASKKIRESKGIAEMPDARTWKRRAVSFIAHGGSDWNQTMMPVMMHFAIPLNLEIVDQQLFPWDRRKLLDEGVAERLKESGRHMVRSLREMPEKMEYIGMKGICPVCHNSVFRLGETADDVSCGLCGITGKLVIGEDGRLSVEFSEEELAVSQVHMGGKFKHLDDMKNIGAVPPEVTEKIRDAKKEYCALFPNTKPH